MQLDTQFSVFLVNKPGVLAQVTESIAKAKINIQALSMMDSSEHGVLRFVCDDKDKAREVLKKNNNDFTETEVLVLTLPNQPGSLASLARKLSEAHVNIAYAYTSGGAAGGKTTCIFKVADAKKATKVVEGLNGSQKGTTKRRQAKIRPTPAARR